MTIMLIIIVIVVINVKILNIFLFIYLLILNFSIRILNSLDPHFSFHPHSTSFLDMHSIEERYSLKIEKGFFYILNSNLFLIYDFLSIPHISIFIFQNSLI